MPEEKAVRVLPFSGLKKDWRKWQAKFMAKARMKGFKKVMCGEETCPAHNADVDTSTDAGKENKRLLDANEIGFDSLMLAQDSEVCFALVQKSVTTELS